MALGSTERRAADRGAYFWPEGHARAIPKISPGMSNKVYKKSPALKRTANLNKKARARMGMYPNNANDTYHLQ